jgi:stage II sporulation protein D
MELFDLSSTNFYVEEVEGGVRFICLGKGSCLGVSQYGANCLANQGKNYEEIIHYYFQNVTIEKYNGSS